MITLKSQEPLAVHQLSERSTAAIPNSVFHATDFRLGAGVVIIQPSTAKVVLVTDKRERWFLPKGRKDKGESLEQTALREAYEEVRLYERPSLHPCIHFVPHLDLMSNLTGPSTPHPPFLILIMFYPHSPRIFFAHTCVSFYLGMISGDRPGIGSSSSLCTRAASRRTLGCLPGIRCPRRTQSRSPLRPSIGRQGIRTWGDLGAEST